MCVSSVTHVSYVEKNVLLNNDNIYYYFYRPPCHTIELNASFKLFVFASGYNSHGGQLYEPFPAVQTGLVTYSVICYINAPTHLS